jgi:hypothetical protein
MMAACSGAHTVDATITILELRGVKCQPKRGNIITRGIKRLSTKYGEYSNVNDNNETITVPNVKAVVSYQHAIEGNDGIARVEQLSSLPMGEESRDEHNNSLVMSGAWPADGDSSSAIHFTKEIQQVKIANGGDGQTEMSIPASVSLQVGLMIGGSKTIQPLGAATVLISGSDQTVDLCIPVEGSRKKTKFSPKKLIGKESTSHKFGVTSWTMLKIKLHVVTNHAQVTTIRTDSFDEASPVIPPVLNDEANPKTCLQLIGSQTKSQANLLKANTKSQANLLRANAKTQVTSLKTNTKSHMSSLKSRALIALAVRKLISSRDNGNAPEHNLPELTVLSPSSDMSTSQSHEGATEIVLNSMITYDASTEKDAGKVATVTSNSFDATTIDDEESSITRTTTVASKSYDNKSSECTIVTEQNESSMYSKSRDTQDTHSSSDKSSESFSQIVITSSRVTFEESKAEKSPPQSPQRVASAEREELFPADVTTQLDSIVRVYSMRESTEKSAYEPSVSHQEEEQVSNEAQAKKAPEPEPTMFANIILNTFSADTPAAPDEKKLAPVLETIQETPNDIAQTDTSQDVQSVILVHEAESGAKFNVELSVDGDPSNMEDASFHEEAPQPSANPPLSFQRSVSRLVNPSKSFEQGYIILKHTMSSIGDLTVDSALDTITLPSVISKSRKVAKNKRHPQRKEAAKFLRRISICGARYDVAEIVDDARVGWRDIVIGDDLCDG